MQQARGARIRLRESWIACSRPHTRSDLALDRKSREERLDRLLRHELGRRCGRRAPDPERAIRSRSRRTAYSAAASCGDLLRRSSGSSPADPQAALKIHGPHSWTALAWRDLQPARRAPHALAIAQRLLDAGADPNFGSDDGCGQRLHRCSPVLSAWARLVPVTPRATALVELLISAVRNPFDVGTLYNASRSWARKSTVTTFRGATARSRGATRSVAHDASREPGAPAFACRPSTEPLANAVGLTIPPGRWLSNT